MKYLDIELEGLSAEGETKKYKLKDFAGKNVIIYFYPQDDTPVCTLEAHDFNANLDKFQKFGVVVGVSKDSTDSHREFKTKHNLNFILLSDTANDLKNAFEEQEKYIVNLHRGTFILNKKGEIIKYWDKVYVEGHVEEIEKFISENK